MQSSKSILSINQSIPDSTWTTIQFNVAIGDGIGPSIYSTSTNNYVVQMTSSYRLYCQVTWDVSSTGIRGIRVVKDGITSSPIYTNEKQSETVSFSQSIDIYENLLSNESLSIQVYQNSGGSLNLLSKLDPSGGSELGFCTFSYIQRFSPQIVW